MARKAALLSDKHESLLAARAEAEAEMRRVVREEEYLLRQIEEAREQVRYYQGLLVTLRRDWGKSPPLSDLVRRLG